MNASVGPWPEAPRVTPAASRVLVIDDDATIRYMYGRLLERAGFMTESANDGQAGLDKLRVGPFDVIFCDVSMPGMDGIEFLRAVRQYDLDVPVVLITGAPSIASAVSAVDYGAFRYLIKPVSQDVLIEVAGRASRLHTLAKLKRKALELFGGDGRWLGDRASLEARFSHALETLWMAYQPIVAWRDRREFGHEALLRTREPTLMFPPDFVQAAERLGRVWDLGRAIRRAVATDAPGSNSHIFLNLHAFDLMDDELYAHDSPLAKLADRVVLEVTERASLDGVQDAPGRVANLRRMGFRIAVDDLGAGYAGLSSLAQLEPDVAKMDMSLVRGVNLSVTKQRVVGTMVELCAELGMLAIAEGVETLEERDILANLGFDLFQGFRFARPGPGFPGASWA